MTTLAADVARFFELGTVNECPMIATDIIYEGAAVGDSGGYARPLAGGDKFIGFCQGNAANTGANGAKNVQLRTSGLVQLAVSGAVITDVGQPVYATDDDTFVFLPTAGSFIGFTKRFVSSGVVMVEFDVNKFSDPYAGKVCETLAAATLTLDAQDCGKFIFVTVDSVVTLPVTATALADVTLVCMGPFGTVQITADPNANDKIMGPNIAGADNKDLVNTKATAKRGDFVTLTAGHADGYVVNAIKGTWAQQG